MTMCCLALALQGCSRDDGPGSAPVEPPAPPPDVVEATEVPEADTPDVPRTPGPGPVAPLSIVVDGLTDDWAEVPWAAAGIKIANDGERVLLLLELDEALALDESPASPVLLLDADGDANTGSPQADMGVDLVWNFGQRVGTAYGPGGPKTVYQADIGLVALPTVSAARFEIALRRQPDSGAAPLEGPLTLDIAGVRVHYEMDSLPSTPPPPLETGRLPGTLRVVTWNMLADGLLDPSRALAFQTVLLELQPDIIAFQEVYSGAESVRERIEQTLTLPEGEAWAAHGFQGRVIVSRYPITTGWPATFDTLSPRFEVAAIELPQGPALVLVNGHMTCCGDDEARLEEATSFASWVADLVAPGGAVDIAAGTPIVLVGDLNLVGSAAPLDMLLTAPDWSGGALVDLVSRHADAPVAYTWRYPTGSFWPGRLDFVIYSSDVLSVARHFVVGESPETVIASDHLPRVVDFVVPDDGF